MSTSRREGTGLHQTGFSAESSYATPRTLRAIASHGLGEPGAVARELARMERTESGLRPEPRVLGLEDVTRGLGLSQDQEKRIQDVIGTRVAFRPTEGEQRLPRVREWLGSLLRSMDLDGATRIEIGRRAMVYWRKFSMPDYQQVPRRRVGKSRPVLTLAKAVAKDSESEDKEEGKASEKPAKFDIDKHPEGGHKIQLHDDVCADLPDDADYQHHATEYAKHSAAYQVLKQKDKDRAEAHRHAANLHARLANAMLQGGKEFRGQEPEQPEELEIQGNGSPSPGQDVQGKPLPGAPDGTRNEPGRDSQIQAKRRVAGQDSSGNEKGTPKIQKGIHFAKGEARHSVAARTLVIPLEKAGGPYYGPRGGKYADPDHKIPWKDRQEGLSSEKEAAAAVGLIRNLRPGDEVHAFGDTATVGASEIVGGTASLFLRSNKDPKKTYFIEVSSRRPGVASVSTTGGEKPVVGKHVTMDELGLKPKFSDRKAMYTARAGAMNAKYGDNIHVGSRKFHVVSTWKEASRGPGGSTKYLRIKSETSGKEHDLKFHQVEGGQDKIVLQALGKPKSEKVSPHDLEFPDYKRK